MKFLLSGLFLLCSLTSFAREDYYQDVSLSPMPYGAQNALRTTFQKFTLHPAFIGPKGSEVLGLNMLFTDDFFVTKVAIKYDVKGEFDPDKIYRFGKYYVLHFQFNSVTNAILFQNIEVSKIKEIISDITQTKKSYSLLEKAFIPKAYATECYAPDPGVKLNLDSEVSENSASALISKCFS